ncbi:MAG TPA: N-acetylmuramoyl-L-alanine amidase [Thermoanaerobaculia bacterium]|nr:N-acetylmuramoyl-L-alanine amidase [Thermoanaerobaculia bacterium]
MTLSRSALLLVVVLVAVPLFAQLSPEAQQMDRRFHEAAAEFDVPVEVLQGIAFVESRWRHIVPEVATDELDARGLRRAARLDEHQPPAYGVMGLRDDDHFGHSLRDAAALIGRSPEELQQDPQLNIRGAAALLAQLGAGLSRTSAIESWEPAVARLSGIPEPRIAEMQTYDVFSAILSGRSSDRFRIAQREISLEAIYGQEQLRVLSAPRLTLDLDRAQSGPTSESADYGPAIWNAAATCNYGAGRSSSVTHVAEHIAQGSYAGTISWFKNCAASVSAHYVVRSSDGQVTQMVSEANTAWHVASHNSYSIGIEHEGFAEDCAWYTTAMYNGSSLLTRDIADSHGIPRTATYDASLGWGAELPQSSPFKIKGHTNFPTTKTCPGACFDWPRFRALVIGSSSWSQIVDNTTSGRFAASANWGVSTFSAQRYGADYRYASPVAASDSAWYKFNIPSTGNYEVYVWYAANAGYNASTPYVVVTSSGNATRNVNQQVNGGAWVSIGTFHFNGGDYNAVGVSRWTSGTGYVIADAVRLVAR